MTRAESYRSALAVLSRRAAILAGATWAQVDSLDEPTEDRFVSVVVPAVVVFQAHAASLTDAYIAAETGTRPQGLDPALFTGSAIRNGTDPAEVYRRPFGVARGALATGAEFAAAMRQAGARVAQTARTDVGLSGSAARSHIFNTNNRITGYRRVTSGKSCPLCAASVGAFTKSTPMPRHPGCDCSAQPIIGKFRPDSLPDTVKVVDHGELGPVLYDAGHQFTQ